MSTTLPDLRTSFPSQPGTQWRTTAPLAECQRELHKKAFAVQHQLAGHPLFTIDALTRVAEQASKRKGDLYVDAGNFSFEDKWGTTPKPNMTIPEIIERIETAGAWLVLKHVDTDPAYKKVLDDFVAFLLEIAGPAGS